MEQKRSGVYKKAQKRGYKVAGLSAEESKKATTLKGKKVSAAQLRKANVLKDIGTTRWEKGKGVVGPGGKAFTGSVILASGKTATYVKGRRVGVQTGKPKAGRPGGGSPPPPPSGGRGKGWKQASTRQEGAAAGRSGSAAFSRAGKGNRQLSTSSTPRSISSFSGRSTGTSGKRQPTPGRSFWNWEPKDWSAWLGQGGPRSWKGGPKPTRKAR